MTGNRPKLYSHNADVGGIGVRIQTWHHAPEVAEVTMKPIHGDDVVKWRISDIIAMQRILAEAAHAIQQNIDRRLEDSI